MQEAFGPYTVVRELGRGGIGVVYEARDPRLGRSVAIKVLRGVPPGDPRLERFRREAQAQAKLSHPNVVALYEVGLARGQPFLVLELVRGRSLRDELVKRGRLPVREALAVVAAIARGVDAVHATGVVHRDLKPENVLLDESGTPKVTDFGIAKDPEADAKSLSVTGALIGTPQYMAPEQVAARKDLISPRTDVWALGVILHELCAGTAPFRGVEIITLLAAIEAESPKRLELDDPLGPAVARVVERALEKEPEKRFASAGELAAACEEALASAKAGGARGLFAAIAPPLVALVVGLAAGAFLGKRSRGEPAATHAPAPASVEARTGRQLLELARPLVRAKDAAGLAALASSPPADESAALLEIGLRALARRNIDPAKLERSARSDAELDAAALAFLLLGEQEPARAAAAAGSPLGELVRRETQAAPAAELSPVASYAHGLAAGARVAVAGETLFESAWDGGPVRARDLAGRLLGFADRSFSPLARHFAGDGARVAWTGPGALSIAHEGLVREHALAGELGPVALVPRGPAIVFARRLGGLVVFDPSSERVTATARVSFEPMSAALSDDARFLAYVGDRPDAPAAVVLCRLIDGTLQEVAVYPTQAKESAVGWIDDALAVVQPGGGSIALHQPPDTSDRRRTIALDGDGIVRALARSREAGVFAVARGTRVRLFYDAETLDECAASIDAGDDVTSLAFARSGRLLVVGRRSSPALVFSLRPFEGDASLDATVDELFRDARGRAPSAPEKANLVGHAREVRDKSRGRGEGQGRTDRHLRWYLRRLLARDGPPPAGTAIAPTLVERLEREPDLEGVPEIAGAAVFLDVAGERLATGGWDGTVRSQGAGEAWDYVRDGAIGGLSLLPPVLESEPVVLEHDVARSNVTLSAVQGPLSALRGRRGFRAITASGPGFDFAVVSPLGERAVLASRTGPARKLARLDLPDRASGSFDLDELASGPGAARALAFLASDEGLATALDGAEGGVVLETGVGDPGARTVIERLDSPPLRALVAAPDARWLVGVDARSGEVLLLESGRKEPRRWPALGGKARALAFSPDGLLLAIVLDSGALTIRAFPSGDERARGTGVALPPDDSLAPPLVWSADGRRLLAGSSPVRVYGIERDAPREGERARLAGWLAEARAASSERPRLAWALVHAAGRAPWAAGDSLADEARELERRFELEARLSAWEAVARQNTGGDRARLDAVLRVLREAK